jgi:hypothetical protein
MERFREKIFVFIPNICNCGNKRYNIIQKLPLLWYLTNKRTCPECEEKLNSGRFVWEITIGLIFFLFYLTNGIGVDFYLKASTLTIILLISPPPEFKFLLNWKLLLILILPLSIFIYTKDLSIIQAITGYILTVIFYFFINEKFKFFIIPLLIFTFLGYVYIILFFIFYILFIIFEKDKLKILNNNYIVISAISTIAFYDIFEVFLNNFYF